MAEVKNGDPVRSGGSSADGLRLPPQNLEAEQAVLGAILIDPKSIDRVMPLLPENAYYKAAHNSIYGAMLELQNEGEPIDTVTLTNYLTKRGLLDKVGGAYYVTGLMEALPSAANVEHYTQIVREKHVLREIINAGQQLISDAYKGEEEPDELLDLAEHRLFDLQRRTQSAKDFTIESILSEAYHILDERHNRQKQHRYSGIPSGFIDLDDMTNGFQPADLVILAGRPSMGKTSLALNIARNAASEKYNHKIGIFSMEMSNYQLAMRFLTAEAGVDSHRMRRDTLGKRDWPKLSKAMGQLSRAPIFIDDTPGLDILGLRSRIRRFKADKDIEMVIIDYLQLIIGRSRIENRQQEMSDISRSLKALARELDITILALSQLSRAPEQRPGKDKRPIMSDLRESGAIEQDADMILFLYRPFVYSHDEKHKGLAELIIGKQRNGPTGTIHLHFKQDITKFVDSSSRDDESIFDTGESPL